MSSWDLPLLTSAEPPHGSVWVGLPGATCAKSTAHARLQGENYKVSTEAGRKGGLPLSAGIPDVPGVLAGAVQEEKGKASLAKGRSDTVSVCSWQKFLKNSAC